EADRIGRRTVVEQRLVDAAELLDAEVAVDDAFARGAAGASSGRQREQGVACAFVVQIAPLGKRGACGREQPSVERRDAEVSGATARMREAGDGPQRVPQAAWIAAAAAGVHEGVDRIAVAIERMPHRYERP